MFVKVIAGQIRRHFQIVVAIFFKWNEINKIEINFKKQIIRTNVATSFVPLPFTVSFVIRSSFIDFFNYSLFVHCCSGRVTVTLRCNWHAIAIVMNRNWTQQSRLMDCNDGNARPNHRCCFIAFRPIRFC